MRVHVGPRAVAHRRPVREIGHEVAVLLPVVGRKLRAHGGQGGLVPGHERHLGAVAGHFHRARPADALGAAADERGEVLEGVRHCGTEYMTVQECAWVANGVSEGTKGLRD